MRKENITPLIIGILVGVVVMFFIQFSAKMIDQRSRLAQIETAVANNGTTISEVVSFIQQSQNAGQGTGTPATTENK
ncbi:MAG: hypothetical protein PHR57_02150 [Patescibacteria group bacterium]|nr:hypothetical protein [Patescibacteria group bacterium]